MPTPIQQSINSAIDFINRSQKENGAFFSYAVNSEKQEEPFETCFYLALTLASIAGISDDRLRQTKQTAIDFLQKEKNSDGSYNYWSERFKNKNKENYPSDLDDTACVFSSLLKVDRALVTEKDLALVTKLLINLEKEVGGPYFTWVLPQDADAKWHDVDLAVNCNIGFLLSMLGIKLTNIEKMVEDAIEGKQFNSSYYYSQNAVLFFISRFYHGPSKEKLLKIIEEKNSHGFANPLECALLGLSLLNLGAENKNLSQNIEYLLSKQEKDGSFGLFPFVIERAGKDERISGCAALTTALAIEFLSRSSEQFKTEPRKEESDFAEIQQRVLTHCRQLIKSQTSKEMFQVWQRLLLEIIRDDSDYQITLHPFLFQKSLKDRSDLSEKYLIDLACASILGWIAYTIYDDILDEESQIDKLPLALVCSRELEDLYCKNNPAFSNVFKELMSRVDRANYMEISRLRLKPQRKNWYPDEAFTAEKSIAHCLGSLAMICQLGYKTDSEEFHNLISFYQKYLTARQINDDAHDWEEDLLRGQINFAGHLLLQDFEALKKREPRLPADLLELRKIFWHKTILSVSDTICRNIHEAKDYLRLLDKVVEQDFLAVKINSLESAAKRSLKEREKTIGYLANLFTEIKTET